MLACELFLDLVRPAVQAALGDVVLEHDRVRAYALNSWAVNLGVAVAVPLGGFLAERGYWWLFAVDAGSSLALPALPQCHRHADGRGDLRPHLAGPRG